MNIDLRQGDCLEVLKTIPDNSVDSVVVDPPYHLTSIVKRFGKEGSAPAQFGTDGAYSRASKGFMGKEWDGGDIAFRTDVWSECLRVLKPGGHLLSFSHSRTYHRMAVAIEDAGFEIRDSIMWIYGSGFPKSHNIGKAIDKIQGNEREVVGRKIQRVDGTTRNKQPNGGFMKENVITKPSDGYIDIEKPGSEDSEMWEGWGTALKPAHEPICMARKPLSEKSIAENVLKWGTGGINIDGCRIEGEVRTTPIHSDDVKDDTTLFGLHKTIQHERVETSEGRFPANIILDEEAGKLLDEQSGISNGNKPSTRNKNHRYSQDWGHRVYDGMDIIGYGDKGGASRFFYCPKTSKKERNMGMDVEVGVFHQRPRREDGTIIYKETHPEEWKDAMNKLPRKDRTSKAAAEEKLQGEKGNVHPTVKPLKLMEYLITLVTPKGGVVMDCFMGSGSTGIAAKNLGFSFIGIEREQEYFDIAQQRIGL